MCVLRTIPRLTPYDQRNRKESELPNPGMGVGRSLLPRLRCPRTAHGPSLDCRHLHCNRVRFLFVSHNRSWSRLAVERRILPIFISRHRCPRLARNQSSQATRAFRMLLRFPSSHIPGVRWGDARLRLSLQIISSGFRSLQSPETCQRLSNRVSDSPGFAR